MFKMIGAMVVYGFALYGVAQAADWLGDRLDAAGRVKAGKRQPPQEAGDVSVGGGQGAVGPA